MPSDEINVVRAFVAAVNRRSVRAIGDLMSDDHVFIDPQGHAQRGREAMLAAWEAYFAVFPDFEIRLETVFAAGDVVAAFGETAGTFQTAHGLLPQNRVVMPAAWQARVKNSRVAFWQVYADWSEGLKIIERARMADQSPEPPRPAGSSS